MIHVKPKVQNALENEDVYRVPDGKVEQLETIILHEGADEWAATERQAKY